MTSLPLISVIIPTWNYGRFLAEAINSVLAQDWPEMEVVIADDASTDETQSVVDSFRDRVVSVRRPERGGTAAARNSGFNQSRGELVCFLDSDDFMVAQSLSSLAGALARHPEAGAAYGLVAQVQQEAFSRATTDPGSVLAGAVPCWMAGGMLIRRTSFLKVGLQDESLHASEFVAWVTTAKDAGLVFHHQPVLSLLRRIHGENKMLHSTNIGADYTRFLRDHLHRKRKAAVPRERIG
jgi:glycosyltransferase involved in cell wall biosynthesis